MTETESKSTASLLTRIRAANDKAGDALRRADATADLRLRRVLVAQAGAWGDEVERLHALLERGQLDRVDGVGFLAELAQQLAPTLSKASLEAALRCENRERVVPPLRSEVVDRIVDRARANLRMQGAA